MIAPGRRADIVLLDDLEACAVAAVISAGRIVDEALFATREPVAPIGRASVKAAPVTAERLPRRGDRRDQSVIGVDPGENPHRASAARSPGARRRAMHRPRLRT